MKIKLIIFLFAFAPLCYGQSTTDSLKINNKSKIDEITNRINKIDNNTFYLNQINELKAQLAERDDLIAVQNDSIIRLLNMIGILKNKTYANNAYRQYISDCNCLIINYELNSAELDSNSIKTLDHIIAKSPSTSVQKLTIYGHTDDIGTVERNDQLSEERAKKVRDYLIQHSTIIKDADITIKWYGNTKPIPNLPNEKRSLNRRSEIFFE